MLTRLTLLASVLVTASASAQTPVLKVPIRSIARLHGAMENTISGVGLVTGLNKTGSGDLATRQAAANLIQRYGLRVTPSDLTTGSVALVSVSAQLPPFAHEGRTVDVRVTTLGDAISLEGGYLEQCELSFFDGANSRVFAVAAGSVSTGGFGASGTTATVDRNFPTSGRVSRGGTIVQALSPSLLSEAGFLEMLLLNPSLGTAQNMVQAIKRTLGDSGVDAMVVDEALVRVRLPKGQQSDQAVLRALSLIRDIEVVVEHPRKVIVTLDTGTIIAGAGVQISPCVVATSDLTISVVAEEEVSQPPPGVQNPGTTERVDRTRIDVLTEETPLAALNGGGSTVSTLMENLKALQLTPRQLIEVFQNLDAGGYLHAPLEVR